MIALVIDSGVVRMVVRCEHAVFDKRANTDRSEHFAESHAVVALVCGEASKVALRNAGDLRTDSHPTRPLRTTVQVKDRSVSSIDQKRRLDRPYRVLYA